MCLEGLDQLLVYDIRFLLASSEEVENIGNKLEAACLATSSILAHAVLLLKTDHREMATRFHAHAGKWGRPGKSSCSESYVGGVPSVYIPRKSNECTAARGMFLTCRVMPVLFSLSSLTNVCCWELRLKHSKRYPLNSGMSSAATVG